MDILDELVRVPKPPSDLLAGLEQAYRQVGARFGYVPVQSPVFLMLQKGTERIGIEVQFGNPHEVEGSLRRLALSGASLCLLVGSSRARGLRLEDIRALLLRKFQIRNQRWVFLDIEWERVVRTNFEWDKFSSEVDRPDWSRPAPLPPRPLFRQTRASRHREIEGGRGGHQKQD